MTLRQLITRTILVLFLFPLVARAQVNIALGKPVTASSTQGTFAATGVTDDNATTRWSSAFVDGQSITVDLGELHRIDFVQLTWEAAYCNEFSLDTSADATTWKSLPISITKPQMDFNIGVNVPARYVRVFCTKRATIYGASLWEFEVFGDPAPFKPWTFAGYDCRPKTEGEARIDKQGLDMVEVWYCDKPTEIKRHHFCHGLDKIPDGPRSISIAAAFALLKPTRPCSVSEAALVERVDVEQGIKITVAPNGTAKTRPIYARKPDNTRGADTGKDIAIGEKCERERLQDANGAATPYFKVAGGYSICKISGAVSK